MIRGRDTMIPMLDAEAFDWGERVPEVPTCFPHVLKTKGAFLSG